MYDVSAFVQAEHTKLFNECSAFFAFSDSQLNDGLSKQSNTNKDDYCSVGMGMICLASKVKDLNEGLNRITNESIANDKKHNLKVDIIRRELYDRECFYTGDIREVADMLKAYDYTYDDVYKVYRNKNYKFKEDVR